MRSKPYPTETTRYRMIGFRHRHLCLCSSRPTFSRVACDTIRPSDRVRVCHLGKWSIFFIIFVPRSEEKISSDFAGRPSMLLRLRGNRRSHHRSCCHQCCEGRSTRRQMIEQGVEYPQIRRGAATRWRRHRLWISRGFRFVVLESIRHRRHFLCCCGY